MEQQKLSSHNIPRRLISLIIAAALTGCSGAGTGVTFNTTIARAEVNENVASVFWTAKAQAGANNSQIKYSISGLDAGAFNFNATTGALSFKAAPDFERPTDSDANNEYIVNFTAQVGQSSAEQTLRVIVKDVSQPTLSLISPKANANVGQGVPIDVEATVKVDDKESNGPLNSGSVTINGVKLAKDPTDPTIWKGFVPVLGGVTDIEVAVVTADNIILKETAKWTNSPGALKPQFMALVPGGYLATIDSTHHFMAKIFLSGMPQWVEYAGNDELFSPFTLFDFNSKYQTTYFAGQDQQLLGASIASAVPRMYYGGTIKGLVGLTYDSSANRLLVITQATQNNQFAIAAVGLSATQGFTNAKTSATRNAAAQTTPVWSVPANVVQGKFKYLSFHRASKTYILSDERTVSGLAQTIVQGFSENGQKRFEASIGADSSVIAVDEAASLAYIAEKSSTKDAKLKAINITNGDVSDLLDSQGERTIGGFSDLRMDNVNKKLYVGDAISDVIYVVDLAAKSLNELDHMPAFTGDPTQDN
ncbi:MAG TPA: cadherin repeat domain-containing protein [Cellvibrionaceae bacterium]